MRRPVGIQKGFVRADTVLNQYQFFLIFWGVQGNKVLDRFSFSWRSPYANTCWYFSFSSLGAVLMTLLPPFSEAVPQMAQSTSRHR